MSHTIPATDVASVNYALKIIHDARYNRRKLYCNEVRLGVVQKYGSNVHWLSDLERFLSDAETKLFSYGSLQPGAQNAHMLEGIAGQWMAGFVYGELSIQQTGPAKGFYTLKPDYTKLKEKVYGKMFVAPGLSEHWKTLDDFEGRDYKRLLTLVYNMASEEIHIATIYAMSGIMHKAFGNARLGNLYS